MMCKCVSCALIIVVFLLCILFFDWIGSCFLLCDGCICTLQSMYQSLLGVYGTVHFAARM